MIKKVAILNNRVEHIYHSDEELEKVVFEGAIIEEREFDYSDTDGWKEVCTLDDIKSLKIKELNDLCKSAILGRFAAIVNDIEYEFSYDAEAQSRFNGIGLLFFANKVSEIEWTAYQNDERVRITLNPSDFNIVSLAALQHQNSNIIKFNQLLQQVNNAITKEQVEVIVW